MQFGIRIAVGLALAGSTLLAHAQFSAKLVEKSKAWGSATADYNNDGHDDIFITGHDKNDRIWYWTPTGYTPSPQKLSWSDRHDCAPADFNGDGMMDFYCAVGAEKGTGSAPNELWLQGPAGQHRKATGFGAEDIYGRSRIPVTFDFNHDGHPDIFLTNEPTPRTDGQPNINQVFVNQGTGTFTRATTIASGMFGAQCAAKGDVNQDGWDDLVVCNMDGPSHIYLNDKAGNFTELVSPAIGPWLDATLADMNGDGRDDLLVLTTTFQYQIWFNSGSGAYFTAPGFVDVLNNVGLSLTVVDINRDGRKDVYVVMRDLLCDANPKKVKDPVSDRLYIGRAAGGWDTTVLKQKYNGCGHLADTVDGDKVLLMNGGGGYVGPNYLISMPE